MKIIQNVVKKYNFNDYTQIILTLDGNRTSDPKDKNLVQKYFSQND